MNPNDLFILNSGLPIAEDNNFLQHLGPSLNGFRGRNIGNGYITYGFLKSIWGYPANVNHIVNIWEDDLTADVAEVINRHHKVAVFVMQDFIRIHSAVLPFKRVTEFIKKIKIPIVPVSLGANSFDGFDPELHLKISKDQIEFSSVFLKNLRP